MELHFWQYSGVYALSITHDSLRKAPNIGHNGVFPGVSLSNIQGDWTTFVLMYYLCFSCVVSPQDVSSIFLRIFQNFIKF